MQTRASLRLSAICVPLLLAQTVVADTLLEFGILYNGIDSQRAGQYSGLRESGSTAVSTIRSESFSGWTDPTGRYRIFEARNLGLENAAVDLTLGRRGRYKLDLDYRGLPFYRLDGPVFTPFGQAGSSRQVLPGGWTGATATSGMTALRANLRDLSIDTDRRHLALQLNLRLNDTRDLKAEYQRQYKKGNDTLGALFGSGGGNARSALLAVPVDYITDNFNLTLAGSDAQRSWSLHYRGSLFSNANAQLQWQNPFNNTAWARGANFSNDAYGTLALAPDNAAHNIGISGVATLRGNTHLSGSLALGRMEQDELLLPYSSAIAADTPLPATRLNGRIDTLTAALNLTQRLTARLNLRLNYTFDSRANATPRYLWLRVPGDSAAQATRASVNAHINLPYGHERQLLRAEAQLRLQGGRQLQFEYQHSRRERDFTEVDLQREDQIGTALLFTVGSVGRGRVELLHARRRNDNYQANAAFIAGHSPDYLATLTGNPLYSDDPLLRRYPLADRDRDQLKAMLNRTLPWRMALNVNGKLTRDDFPSSQIGRQSSNAWDVSVYLTQQISNALDWTLWHTRQGYANKQAGYSRGNTTPILPESARTAASNWWMDTQDLVATSGLGWSWSSTNDRLSVKGDFSYSDAGTTHAPLSRGLAFLPFPDIETRFTTVNLGAELRVGEGGSVGLRYRYEDFTSTDFALDAVAVDSLNNVILLGNGSPVYAGSVIQLSYTWLMR